MTKGTTILLDPWAMRGKMAKKHMWPLQVKERKGHEHNHDDMEAEQSMEMEL